MPLVFEMDDLICNSLPRYYQTLFAEVVMTEGRPADKLDLSRIRDPHDYRRIASLGTHFWPSYTLRGTLFSTLQLNRNNLFKAHEDGHNAEFLPEPGRKASTLVGLVALGDYAGGRFVFPRYSHSATLEHGDLLICDNNHEMHGNLGPIVGERFSVVAFLHESVRKKALDVSDPEYEPHATGA